VPGLLGSHGIATDTLDAVEEAYVHPDLLAELQRPARDAGAGS